MSLTDVLGTCARFDREVLDLELAIRVVLRSEHPPGEKLERVEVLFAEAIVGLARAVSDALRGLGAVPAESMREAGERVAMTKMMLGNRVASMCFVRHLLAQLLEGKVSPEDARACAERALGVVPFELPAEQWIDAVVPRAPLTTEVEA